MITVNYPWQQAIGADSATILFLAVVYTLFWLLTLGLALTRADLDPVERLMWVLVVIFVPVAGVLLYLFLSPARHPFHPSMKKHELTTSLGGTPWENNPGHTRRSGN